MNTNQTAPAIGWRKSSHSGPDGGQCIEINEQPATVLVRDSKDKNGPHLTFTPDAWAGFVEMARAM